MSYKHHKHKGLAENIFDTLLKGLWFLISWPFKKLLGIRGKGARIDKAENLEKWRVIESMLETDDEIHAKQAVLEADKFFDNILKKLGARGGTFADRLKNFENHFSYDSYQSVWQAHKTRNQISHEMNYRISINEARLVLNKFRQGLRNLGTI